MSFKVTDVVRRTCLPKAINYQRRPAAKLALWALADRCDDDGRNAWPSIATIARESQVHPRTAIRILRDLEHCGLIHEQARPSQHRPRTWRIDLTALLSLATTALPDARGDSLGGSGTETGMAALGGLAVSGVTATTGLEVAADGSGVTTTTPGVTAVHSRPPKAATRSCPDPVLLNQVPAPQTARISSIDEKPKPRPPTPAELAKAAYQQLTPEGREQLEHDANDLLRGLLALYPVEKRIGIVTQQVLLYLEDPRVRQEFIGSAPFSAKAVGQ